MKALCVDLYVMTVKSSLLVFEAYSSLILDDEGTEESFCCFSKIQFALDFPHSFASARNLTFCSLLIGPQVFYALIANIGCANMESDKRRSEPAMAANSPNQDCLPCQDRDVSPYVDSESDNECRRPTPNGRNKAGKPRKTIVKDTLVQDNQKEVDQNEGAKTNRKNRYSSFTVTDCKAAVRFKAIHGTKCYKLYDFVENHNHPLVDENNLDNLKSSRKWILVIKVFYSPCFTFLILVPTKAHRLRVAFMGGYHKVRGKAIDWKNFRRSLNKYIGPRDAQMLVDKLNDRKKHVPNFSFEYKTVNDELSRMYYLVMKTFHSTTWLLTAFKQVHGKEPLMAVTDQDAALRNAIEFVFPGITSQICGDVENDSEFKKLFHKLIWNVHIGPEEFEQRWHALIGMFNLSANSWLTEMFEIRDRWIPGYFKDLPMCCLMKTTSRSESSNAFFRIHSHQGNMLVQFMLCFEAAMEKQRYTQRIADNRTFESTPVMFTALPIERFGGVKCIPMSSPIDTQGIRNKGCGYTGPHEKATEKAKGNPKVRVCSICHQVGHNARTCHLKKNKGNEINVDAFQAEE
ncbi:FAR1-related sequence 5-like protein [Tanacetum coccineum]